jgi:photosystem II stability/assembly factor-like uncharacterized protein
VKEKTVRVLTLLLNSLNNLNKIAYMRSGYLFFLLIFCRISFAQSPHIEILTNSKGISLRGLSVVSDRVIWASGSNGMVAKSVDGGKNWTWIKVKGFEKNDFRDIEAFDEKRAVIMAIGEPAYILRTTDGGSNWKVVYENKTKGMFLDAMEFWNEDAGIAIGDPIHGRFFITRSFDGGKKWQDIPFAQLPKADSGEACFAASGTNIRALKRDEAVFISGGMRSKFYRKNESTNLPLIQGQETTGANSIAIWDNFRAAGEKNMVVVGGDFKNDSSAKNNCALSYDSGKTWDLPDTLPHGYRSCVEYLTGSKLICCGLTGVDYSINAGRSWTWISHESFHTCRRAKNGNAVYLCGVDGRIARLENE